MTATRILSLGFSSLLAGVAFAATDPAGSLDVRTLPMAVISYAFGTAYESAPSLGEGRSAPYGRLMRSLESSLSALGAELPMKLAFVTQARLIEPQLEGSRVLGEGGVNTLYVVNAAFEQVHRVVVIVSSANPETTAIFTLDDALNAKLIYDSKLANRFAKGVACEPLGEVVGARVKGQGVIVLEEQKRRAGALHERSFAFDARPQIPTLSCVPVRPKPHR